MQGCRALAFVSVLLSHAAWASPQPAWVSYYNGPATHQDHARRVLAAPSGIYVGGETYSTTDSFGGVLLRYSPTGTPLWERHFDAGSGFSDESIADLAPTDDAGVVATGFARTSNGAFVFVLRYSAAGDLLWQRLIPVSGVFDIFEIGPRVQIDPSQRVLVAFTNAGDFAVHCLDSQGNDLWNRRIDPAPGKHDEATSLAVDELGNSYVTGTKGDGFQGYATIMLDPDGNTLWTNHENGPIGATLGPSFVAIGPDGLPVVNGTPETTCGLFQSRTWKVGPDGAALWTTSFPPLPCDTVAPTALAVDHDGNILVFAGSFLSSDPGGFNFCVLKYSPDGTPLWFRTLDGSGSTEIPEAMTVGRDGAVFITGATNTGGSAYDAITAAYSPEGSLLWAAGFDHGAPNERSADIALTPRGDICVVGSFYTPATNDDIFTLLYRRGPRAAAPR